MNQFNLNLLILLAVVLTIVSCKKPDETFDINEVYSIYDVTFDENTEVTTAYAQFRNKETAEIVRLENALVQYNSDTLKYIEDIDAYAITYVGGQITTGTFTTRLEDGTVYVNTPPAIEPIFFEPTLDSVFQSEELTILWLGTPLSENQRVDISIGPELFTQSQVGANTIKITEVFLKKIDLGFVDAFMERVARISQVEGTPAGGHITSIYVAKKHTIQVFP